MRIDLLAGIKPGLCAHFLFFQKWFMLHRMKLTIALLATAFTLTACAALRDVPRYW